MLLTFCKFSSWLVAGWVEAAPSSVHSPAQASLQSEAPWKVLQLLEFCNYFTSVEGKWALEMFKTRPCVHHSPLINWSNLFQRAATNLNIFKPKWSYILSLGSLQSSLWHKNHPSTTLGSDETFTFLSLYVNFQFNALHRRKKNDPEKFFLWKMRKLDFTFEKPRVQFCCIFPPYLILSLSWQ